MKRAIDYAHAGSGCVHPNPLVGAVLVKNKKIIGCGAHQRFGQAHAEVNAILNCKADPTGSELYVTLEPCCHFGKTPPCTDFVLRHRIQKVFIAVKDPNPLVSGKGIRALRKAGIRVVVGVLEKEAMDLNRDYFHWVQKKMPYCVAKIAQSLDGKIATSAGESRWITGEKARLFGHKLRAQSDAVLVGVETILQDDPILRRAPIKIVVDSRLRAPFNAAIFSEKSKGSVILAVTKKASAQKRKKFSSKAQLVVTKEKKGRVHLADLFQWLAKKGIVRLLVEGGGEVIASALGEKLVNEVYFFIAPKIIGGKRAVSSVSGEGAKTLREAVVLKHLEIQPIGADWLAHGII